MGIFHQKSAFKETANFPDYYFLDRIAPTISADRAAHLMAVKAVLGDKQIPVLSGGLDPRAEDNFEIYRDKGHFFLRTAQCTRIFFAELHGHARTKGLEMTALPLNGYLASWSLTRIMARSATVYNNRQNQPVYRVDRDEAGTVTAINYYADGKPVRVDTYDHHHCLLMSEQFGAVANATQSDVAVDAASVHSLMSRTLYSEEGRPVFSQTYSPAQLWLLDEHAVPIRLFNTEAAMMAGGSPTMWISTIESIWRRITAFLISLQGMTSSGCT